MKTLSLARGLLAAALAASVLLTGCVSAKYQAAPKDTPPPAALSLKTEQPPVSLSLETMIVYRGPGSWKKEAWWDEYIVTVTNSGEQPLVLDGFILSDVQEMTVVASEDPWALESLSRSRLKHYERSGVALYVGTGVVWAASPLVALGSAFSGATTAGAISTAVFFAAPVFLIGTGVARHVARKDIEQEFHARRIALPTSLLPGESRRGSLFFPIAPGPQHLSLRYHIGETSGRLQLPLTGLADLHLKSPPGPAPRRTETPRTSSVLAR